MNEIKTLSLDDVRKQAPSVFAETRNHETTSERYSQVRTVDVLNTLIGEGWNVVSARQKRVSRRLALQGRANYTAHEVGLTHPSMPSVDGVQIRTMLSNAHDGTRAYRFDIGIFVLVCTNGLVRRDADTGSIRLRHVGLERDAILNAAKEAAERTKTLPESIERMRGTQLSAVDALTFAEQAFALRFPKGNDKANPLSLLIPRRRAESMPTLWNVFNRVQETLIRGIRLNQIPRSVQASRGIHAVPGLDAQMRLNKALWTLAESYVKVN